MAEKSHIVRIISLLTDHYAYIILLLILILLYTYQRSKNVDTSNLPWINRAEDEWFGKFRAKVRTTRYFRTTLLRGYENYSSKNLAFTLPTLSQNFIVLPHSAIPWLINQPDNVLNVESVREIQLQLKYTFNRPEITLLPIHHEVIKAELTRKQSSLASVIMDELKLTFDEVWGTDTSCWRDIPVFPTVMRIIARASNRAIVGEPLCRNNIYLDCGSSFAQALPVAAMVINQFPQPTWPLIGAIVRRFMKRYRNGFAKQLRPEIEQRQASKSRHTDFLQWTLERMKKSEGREKLSDHDIEVICDHILVVNFAAIHTTSLTVTNLIFDLVSSKKSYIDDLRQEIASVLEEDNGILTKTSFTKMYKVDSALRESSRLSSFVTIGLPRRVMLSEGVTAPNGTHCPFGSIVTVPNYAIHHDSKIYQDADDFIPFRFSDLREEKVTTKTNSDGKENENEKEEGEEEDYLKKANLSFVSTSSDYQAFGHGRHACPGRFFASQELKLLLVYMLMNYDFEMMPKKPEGQWIGPTLLPPLEATIKIKRRKES